MFISSDCEARCLNVYEQRLQHQAYIRLVNTRLDHFKKLIIYATGTPSLQRLLKQRQIPHNLSFSGIYDFNRGTDYRQLFRGFLTESTTEGLVMCHPGGEDSEDSISKARLREYNYFMSDHFLTDSQHAEVAITRFLQRG